MSETIITNKNIKDLVRFYLDDKNKLPDDLKDKPIGKWNVSRVTKMIRLFSNTNFNENINDWDVSNVIDMNGLFNEAIQFNQPLDKWKTGNVKNMEFMFYNAHEFNQSIGDWDVSKVQDMSYMFKFAHEFNQPLDKWNVSNVEKMPHIFTGATKFNQDLTSWQLDFRCKNELIQSSVVLSKYFCSTITNDNIDFLVKSYITNKSKLPDNLKDKPIGQWDVSGVTDMSSLFKGTNFNENINDWDVSNVVNMNMMFYNAKIFNQPLDKWIVSNVKFMSEMFNNAAIFNQPIGNWDVRNVVNMSGMFFKAHKFNQPIGNWNVENVIYMRQMFAHAEKFNQPICEWNVRSVIDMPGMFHNAAKFNQSIEDWNISNVKNMNHMFYNATSFKQNLDKWKPRLKENVKNENMFTGSGTDMFDSPRNISPTNLPLVKKNTQVFDTINRENYDLYDVLMSKTEDTYDYWVFIHRFNGKKVFHYSVPDEFITLFIDSLGKYSDNTYIDLYSLGIHNNCSFKKKYLISIFKGKLNKYGKPNLYLIEDGKETMKLVDADEYFQKEQRSPMRSPIRRPRVTRKRPLSRSFVPYKKTLKTQLATLMKEPSTRKNAIDIAATKAQLNNATNIHKEMSQFKFRNEKSSSIPRTIKRMKSHSHSPRKYTRSKSRSPNQYTRSI